MNYEPACAVCGHSVAPDSDHTEVERKRARMNDRDGLETYYLHSQCARAVFEGWRKP